MILLPVPYGMMVAGGGCRCRMSMHERWACVRVLGRKLEQIDLWDHLSAKLSKRFITAH